jgi:5-methyltetrahydropteroyltriglutamate--homocysteine methyltransferase
MSGEYKSDHVGSFLRPAAVREARTAKAEGRIDATALAEVEDAAILAALESQRSVGIGILSDGEFRRTGFQNDFMESVEGYVSVDRPSVERMWQGPGGAPVEQGSTRVIGGLLTQLRRLTATQTAFLQSHAPGPFKMTVPSPNQFPTLGFQRGVTDEFYESRVALLWAIADIIKGELAALANDGVPYIQIDAPRYAYWVDPKWVQHLRDLGEEPDTLLDQAIAADAACFEGVKREGVTTALHVCRGNNQSKWYAQGGYEPIAEKLFGTIAVDRLLLEYDTERAGGFEPLRFVGKDTTVVLGLVSTKGPELEDKNDLLRRIDEASHYVPVERLALSPQCGFASTASGNLLTEDEQWRKLELVCETAREVWG